MSDVMAAIAFIGLAFAFPPITLPIALLVLMRIYVK